MNIVQEIENKYRSNAKHGVTFSIDADAYDCRIGDRITFGDNTEEMAGGTLYNYQDILLDGKCIGYLQESQRGRLFDPMCVSFCIPIADCTEHDMWEQMEHTHKGNPHLCDNGETLLLKFATLNQLLDYLKVA